MRGNYNLMVIQYVKIRPNIGSVITSTMLYIYNAIGLFLNMDS